MNIHFNRRDHNCRKHGLATSILADISGREVDSDEDCSHEPENESGDFNDRHDDVARDSWVMRRCQCEVWSCDETGPDTIEQHEFDYIVKLVGAENCYKLLGRV